MRNNYKFIALVISLLIFLTGCGSYIDPQNFNKDNAYNHIVELSSDKYEGRLPGTEGNKMAEEYIAKQFEKIGLEPINSDGSYLQIFKIISPILKHPVKFEVLDKDGRVIKEYKLRKDFAENTRDYAKGGQANGKIKFINLFDDIEVGKDNIVLTYDDLKDTEKAKMLVDKGVKAVIRPTTNELRGKDKNLLIKTVYIGEKANEEIEGKYLDIIVTEEVFKELIDFGKKGYSVNIDINLIFEEVEISNVIGYIPGSDEKLKKETILISAHFDHVGTEPDGIVFNGALDNASGTGMLLELARVIKESGKKPKRTIVFAAFNGEESGLQGSKYYVLSRPFPLVGTKVFNIDMIGSKEKVNLQIDTFPSQQRGTVGQLVGSELAEKIAELAEEYGIQCSTSSFSSNSDHLSFNLRGVPAVTLSHPSSSLIHTVEDDISNVDKERLGKVGTLMLSLIDYYAFNAKDVNQNIITDEQLHTLKLIPFYFLAISIIVLLFLFTTKLVNKNENLRKVFKGKPIFTSILVMLILLSILVYNSSYEVEEVSSKKSLSKPWENQVKVTGNSIEKILDFEINENINILVKAEEGIKLFILDKKGRVTEEKPLKIPYEKSSKYMLSENRIYYTYNSSLFHTTYQSEEGEKVLENVKDFDILENQGEKYIIVGKEDEIIIKSEQWEKSVKDKGIINFLAQTRYNDRMYILYKQKARDNILIKCVVFNNYGEFQNPIQLYTLKEDSQLAFGLDKAKGYILFKEQDDYYKLSFYLSDRRNRMISKDKIELHDDGGALVKIQEIPVLAYGQGNDNIDLYMSVNTENHIGNKYIYLLNLFNGKLKESKVIYQTKKTKLLNPVIDINGKDIYIAWLEGKNNNDLKISSSNRYFAYNSLKNEFIVRLSKVVQNLFLTFVVLFTKLHWILPGVLLLIILKILKKDKWLANGKAIYAAISINLICQMVTFQMPNITGIRYENIIITFLIGIIALGLVLFYKYEKGKASLLRLFIIFRIINMIYIITLYAPYTLKGGLERLNQVEMFNEEEY